MIQITIFNHSHQIKMLFVPLCNYTNLKIPLILPLIALHATGKRSLGIHDSQSLLNGRDRQSLGNYLRKHGTLDGS